MITVNEIKASDIPEELMNMLRPSRLPHAVLIEGCDKEKLMKLAEYTAFYINCNGDLKPCGECDMCRGFSADLHIWGGEFLPKYPIRDFREALRDVYKTSNKWDKSVYVLANCETMAPRTQNALLKLLEEPPKSAQFIMLCEDAGVMLETVMSRVAHVKTDTALRYSEDVITKSTEFASALCAGDKAGIMRCLAYFDKDKAAGQPILKLTVMILRDILVRGYGEASRISGVDLNGLPEPEDIDGESVIKAANALSEMAGYAGTTVNSTLLGAYCLANIL